MITKTAKQQLAEIREVLGIPIECSHEHAIENLAILRRGNAVRTPEERRRFWRAAYLVHARSSNIPARDATDALEVFDKTFPIN